MPSRLAPAPPRPRSRPRPRPIRPHHEPPLPRSSPSRLRPGPSPPALRHLLIVERHQTRVPAERPRLVSPPASPVPSPSALSSVVPSSSYANGGGGPLWKNIDARSMFGSSWPGVNRRARHPCRIHDWIRPWSCNDVRVMPRWPTIRITRDESSRSVVVIIHDPLFFFPFIWFFEGFFLQGVEAHRWDIDSR